MRDAHGMSLKTPGKSMRQLGRSCKGSSQHGIRRKKNLIDTSRRQLQGAYNYVSRKAEEFTRSALQETLKSCEYAFQGPGLTAIEQNMRCPELDSQLGADLTKRVSSHYFVVHSNCLTVPYQGP